MDIMVHFYNGNVTFEGVLAFSPNQNGFLWIGQEDSEHFVPVGSFEYFTVIDYDLDG